MSEFRRDVYCVLGMTVDAMDAEHAEQHIRDSAARRVPCFLSTPNVNFVVGSRSDPRFRDSVTHSDVSVADGMPLVWLARLTGVRLPERVAGATLFERLRAERGETMRVFLFGGDEGAAREAADMINGSACGMQCVGHEFPGFGSVEEMSQPEILARINASGADFLVVALGARKGQAWIEHNRERLTIPVVSHLGAVMNFAGGRLQRAPRWMQRSGLEWMWRIKEEPRLWWRYFRDGLTLARLTFTRVLPHAWYLLSHRRAAGRIEAAKVEETDAGAEYQIRLAGPWSRRNLDPLRAAFERACASGKPIRLETGDVTYVDSAFIGLVMLLHANQARAGRPLAISSRKSPVEKMMKYCCADDVFEECIG
jgi:N-acetylglucosaminyldiphosphoundecaprenol N-acetyl-beta-D-mannosaminyltransferase